MFFDQRCDIDFWCGPLGNVVVLDREGASYPAPDFFRVADDDCEGDKGSYAPGKECYEESDCEFKGVH